MRRLRVVHVITTLTTGGAERQVELVASASRHDVRVVSLYEGGVVADALRERGVPVDVLGMAGWRKAAAIPRLARLLRRHRPDVVHVHLLSAQLWGIPAARLARVPVVISTEHSIMATTIEGRPHTETLRRLYLGLERLSTHTIAVSDATVERLRAWGVPDPDGMTVVNPPIDFEVLRAEHTQRDVVRTELGLPADAEVIGSVGRLDPVKRHEPLVRALAGQLRAGRYLVLVGDGPLRARIAALAGELGVADHVRLTGPRPDVARLLSAFDVFVSPSRDETFGMAIVEAVGAGLPVVYAQCPALDGLDLDPSRIVELDATSVPEQELVDLAAAVERVLPTGYADPPGSLVDRYGVARTAQAVDAVYDRFANSPDTADSAGDIRPTTSLQR